MALSQGLCVRCQVAKLGGQMGRLFTVLDGIYLFKHSQMLPMPPFSYGCAPALRPAPVPLQPAGATCATDQGRSVSKWGPSRGAELFDEPPCSSWQMRMLQGVI